MSEVIHRDICKWDKNKIEWHHLMRSLASHEWMMTKENKGKYAIYRQLEVVWDKETFSLEMHPPANCL